VIARTAFVGLGRMGLPMALQLRAANATLVSFDVEQDVRERARRDGLEVARTLAEAVVGAEVVFVSLPTLAAVLEVVGGESGVLDLVSRGGVVVDLSTSSPAVARELAAEGDLREVHVIDAPVSGGPPRAENGTLTIMVGGSENGYAIVRPYLELLGNQILRMGGPGAGQATKLCNNLLAGVAMTALAEAVALAEAEHLDLSQLFEALTTSTGDSAVLRRRYPVPGVVAAAPVNRDFEPQFPVAMMQKDLDLALESANAHSIDLPITAHACDLYRQAAHRGLADLDYSAVTELYSPLRPTETG
jgi:3-hydroxyisobutyrate dehydrogenase